MREIDAIAVSVRRKAHPVCCSLCANSKNTSRRSLTSALVVKCYWLLCVSWPIVSCYGTGVSFWTRCERINRVRSFLAIKTLCLLSSSHKDIVWLQKTWNATQLVCNAFILLLLSVFAINTCDCTWFACCVFFIVQK